MAVESLLLLYFRHRGFIDGLIHRFATGKTKPELRRLLCALLTQGHFQTGVVKEVACSVAVDHARRVHGRQSAGFVNAVARKALSVTYEEFVSQMPDAAAVTIPAPLLRRWRARIGHARTDELARLFQKKPLFTARLVQGKPFTPLAATGFALCEKWPWSGSFTFLSAEKLDSQKRLFESDELYAQDPATALAPVMLAPHDRQRVLDLCAAPGGKTLMLSELTANGVVIACDRSPRRLAMLGENLRRLAVRNVRLAVADGVSPPLRDGAADAVLLDVPCSNTGVARRRPDALWRFSEERLRELVALQGRILRAAATLLAPGGAMVYSTCSLEPEENEKQVKRFLKAHPSFELVKAMELLPAEGHDGAYAALITKGRKA